MRRIRSIAGRPLSASISTDESRRIRVTINRTHAHRNSAAIGRIARGHHPKHACVFERPENFLDLIPALLIIRATPYELLNERTPLTSTGTTIEFANHLVIQVDMQTHVLS